MRRLESDPTEVDSGRPTELTWEAAALNAQKVLSQQACTRLDSATLETGRTAARVAFTESLSGGRAVRDHTRSEHTAYHAAYSAACQVFKQLNGAPAGDEPTATDRSQEKPIVYIVNRSVPAHTDRFLPCADVGRQKGAGKRPRGGAGGSGVGGTGELSEYEQKRQRTMQENAKVLESLQIQTLTAAPAAASAPLMAASAPLTRPKPIAGEDAFRAAKQLGHWPDGKPYGNLLRMAFLRPMYADDLYTGAKRLEGRPLGHPISKAQPNDAGPVPAPCQPRASPVPAPCQPPCAPLRRPAPAPQRTRCPAHTPPRGN